MSHSHEIFTEHSAGLPEQFLQISHEYLTRGKKLE